MTIILGVLNNSIGGGPARSPQEF